MSKFCNACNEKFSKFVMNNRQVCFRCDELLFDIEIECDEQTSQQHSPFEERRQGHQPIWELNKKITKVGSGS